MLLKSWIKRKFCNNVNTCRLEINICNVYSILNLEFIYKCLCTIYSEWLMQQITSTKMLSNCINYSCDLDIVWKNTCFSLGLINVCESWLWGYLLLISYGVEDPGEAWRSLWTLYWALWQLSFKCNLRSRVTLNSLHVSKHILNTVGGLVLLILNMNGLWGCSFLCCTCSNTNETCR